MRKIIASIVCVCTLFISGCGDSKVISGKEYETYGILNRDEIRSEDIHYSIITGNCIWGIILCSTVIAPIYFFGFSLYEPKYSVKEK